MKADQKFYFSTNLRLPFILISYRSFSPEEDPSLFTPNFQTET